MTSSNASFNLIDRPWIPVIQLDGETTELSIREVLLRSSTISAVVGDVPTQAFAIQRLLLAILRRAIPWDPDEPIGNWMDVWDAGQLPTADIDHYLDRVASRFDLWSKTVPFLQVADLATARGEFKSPDVLIADVPPNERYFTSRAGTGTESLTFAESARWLLHTHAYDPSGIRSGDPRDPRTKGGKGYPIGVSWCGMLGGILLEGDSLFQTLLLNTVLRRAGEFDVVQTDLPSWEREPVGPAVRGSSIPTGPTDLLTWQSRRIRLHRSGDRVIGAMVGQGDPVEPFNKGQLEYHTPWRYSEIQTKKFGQPRYFPKTHDPERAIWRGLESLLSTVSDPKTAAVDRFRPPEIITWLGELLLEGAIPLDTVVRPHAFGMEYVSQSSVIRSATDDILTISASLVPHDSHLRQIAERAVRVAEDAATALAGLARDLARTVGAEDTGDTARAQGFYALDQPYRRWLSAISSQSDPEIIFVTWERTVGSLIEPIARDLIRAAGPAAWRGREVQGRWLDSSLAQQKFWRRLREAIPDAFPSPKKVGPQ